MFGAGCLLALLSYFIGVESQPTVIQPPSESAPLGQSVKLTCTASSGGSWYYFSWFQQRPGQTPRFVQCAGCSSSNRGEGIPDRYSASKSGNVGYLTITNLQPEDEFAYYCIAWEDNTKQCHSDATSWGTET